MTARTEYAAKQWVTHAKVAVQMLDRIDQFEMPGLYEDVRRALLDAYRAGVAHANNKMRESAKRAVKGKK